MRRPTQAAGAVVGCGVVLILLSGPAQAAWLGVLGALVLGVPLGSAAVRHRLAGAAVELSTGDRARVGDEVTVRVRVRAPDHPLPLHRLDLIAAPLGDAAVLVEPVHRGGSARCELTATVRTRGVFADQRVRLRSGAPFGLLRSDVTISVGVALEVGARLVPLPVWVARSVAGDSDAAAERRRGGGDEVHAIREFRSGDALRDVHWRSTARAGRLVVREYERAEPTRTVVAVLGGDAGDAFEALVSAAASIAHALSRSGEPVDLIRVTRDGAVVVVTGASQHGLHSWSAAVEPVAADAAEVARVALAGGRPSAVVLAAAPGVARLTEACAALDTAGSAVTVISAATSAQTLPLGIRRVTVSASSDLTQELPAAFADSPVLA